MEWKTVLAYMTGTVDQELLLRNEYLVAENRILRNQITGRVRLTDGERTTLAALGKRLGKQALAEVMSVVKPETLLAWHRKLIAKKFDGSQHRGIQDGHDSIKRLSNWSSNSPKTIVLGDTIELWGL
jgi:putative transposase